jgi:uptake hydrogenase small subunit
VTQNLVAIASGRVQDIALDDLRPPAAFFNTFTQTAP